MTPPGHNFAPDFKFKVMDKTLLNAITTGQTNVTISVNAADLKEVFNGIVQAERERAQADQARADAKKRGSLTRTETAAALRVSTNTLGRWAKAGYLVPVKVGVRVLYNASEVEEILANRRL